MTENDPARLQKLKGLGFRLEYLREIDSTNQEAMRRAANGEPSGLVLLADHQTQGRGRLGRTWQAEPLSSLLASVLVKPEIAPASLGLVPIVSGLALAQAIEAAAHFQPGLVWPNDLFGAQGKIAGILVESIFEKSDLKFIVIGSGVNLAQKKADFPAEIRARASSLYEETGD